MLPQRELVCYHKISNRKNSRIFCFYIFKISYLSPDWKQLFWKAIPFIWKRWNSLNEDKVLENKNEDTLIETSTVITCPAIGGKRKRMTQTTLSQERRQLSLWLREETQLDRGLILEGLWLQGWGDLGGFTDGGWEPSWREIIPHQQGVGIRKPYWDT